MVVPMMAAMISQVVTVLLMMGGRGDISVASVDHHWQSTAVRGVLGIGSGQG